MVGLVTGQIIQTGAVSGEFVDISITPCLNDNLPSSLMTVL